ncbi:disulfide bond formation protein B [Bordetella genomosp. 13]|uniref:Disulfide bond formation protein B n=1 Tax=Bordetella genomosp. 13 TaxID=463040 RepID=A0A1W6ZAD1_9BORD|nr:disulfide bond formation protein B [Bordetella genomosp. 13]ARP94279.1 disulfide bond formation protein B [Bordetella genomosp. 13]
MISTRERLLLLISALCFGALGVALISQHVYDMPPCAWCVFQRLLYLGVGVAALIGAVTGGVAARIEGMLAAMLSAGGIVAAWYQYTVAAKMLSCDQTFADRFMVSTGLDAAVPWLFGIYATCMDAVVHVLGVEYALWSLALFALLLALSLVAALRRYPA